MAATTVNGKLLSPAAGQPASSQVTITLVDYDDAPVVGFNTVDDTEILATDTIIPTPAGLWTAQLVPNADIQLTDGTVQTAYRVTESGAGSTFTYWILVAASVNPVWAGSIRTTLVGNSGGATPNGYAIQGALSVGGKTTLSGGLTIPTGAAAGKVWTATDSAGDGSWQTPTGGGGSGTVVSVNHVGPDGAGNITLAAADVGAAQRLIPTAVKTGAYTAQAGDLVPVDATAGNVAIALVSAPVDGTVIGVKMVTTASGHTTTVTCGGADVYNKAGGATVATLTLTAQAILLQYSAGSGIWYVVGDDLPLTQLDARYVAKTSPVALTDGATIATDASLSNLFRVTLGGNRTLSNPTNGVDGQLVTWSIKQDATGSRTLTMDTKFRFGTDITSITLTTTAGKTDHIGARYNSSDDKWDVIAFVRGF